MRGPFAEVAALSQVNRWTVDSLPPYAKITVPLLSSFPLSCTFLGRRAALSLLSTLLREFL